MTKSRSRSKRKPHRFEAAGTVVLGRARAKRGPSSPRSLLHRLRNILLWSLVAGVAGALWLTLDERFYVQHVDVVGQVRGYAEEILQASELPGLHILWVRPAEIEARTLAALPSLESAQVACGLSAQCTITVVRRQPRVTWDDGGTSWWIDEDGVIFPAEAQGTMPEGWLVQGPLPQDDDSRLDERVRVTLSELWTVGTDVPQTLTYVPGRGLTFIDERGWRVILGRGPGMEERLRVLDWLAADLEARGLTPRFVDVRFADAPYYSLTNEW